MDSPQGGSAPGESHDGRDVTADSTRTDSDPGDAELVIDVLHRIGRCPLRSLRNQPELHEWTPTRLEQAVVRAWNGGLVFIDRNDDLVAL